MSKIKQIQEWLESGKQISTILAIQLFDCMDLKSMIHKLRSNGIPIKSRTVGNLTTYFIEKENG